MAEPTITSHGSTQPKTWRRDVRYRCILLQLNAGVTFCAAADVSAFKSQRSLNIERAARVYWTAMNWAGATELTLSMKDRVKTEAAHLKGLLCRSSEGETALAFANVASL